MAATASSTLPAISSRSYPTTTTTSRTHGHGPICSFPCSNFLSNNLVFNSTLKPSRLRISQKIGIAPKHVFLVPIGCCLGDNNSQVPSESAPASVADDLKGEASVDLKLPRRSLLVQFTCNACGERTERLINRLAYERGTIFLQCAGCLQHHKFIDNLGLVVEYDFRKENEMASNAEHEMDSNAENEMASNAEQV